MATTFGSDFRRFFARGLATILPTVLTVALIIWLIQVIHRYVGRYIADGAQILIVRFSSLQADQLKQTWADYRLDFVGFLLAIVLVYIVGRVVASFLGRAAWRSLERILIRLPLIKQIYPSIKQVTDFLILNEAAPKFSRVVAVEYPRKGLWSIGLVTNPGMRTLQRIVDADLLTIFIPSSPTPFTGYTITVRRDETVDLPFDIDQALRFLISGGVLIPPAELLGEPFAGRMASDLQPFSAARDVQPTGARREQRQGEDS